MRYFLGRAEEEDEFYAIEMDPSTDICAPLDLGGDHFTTVEYQDIFPAEVPKALPPDHEIDLVPGTKYCVTRQWPLPREQVEAIDKFFEARRAAGHVRESVSPHSNPTLCVKKATGGWRIVHAFNKLNDTTIPAQTPIPRKDMILDSMSGSEVFTAINLMDGFYQILMREQDIPPQQSTPRAGSYGSGW
ncbi:hypothetical protein ATCC90586_000865 [Pythium insidiosum]|nr:hypothetical protein ATCC90586_000865 [Pythium insidiosum]